MFEKITSFFNKSNSKYLLESYEASIINSGDCGGLYSMKDKLGDKNS